MSELKITISQLENLLDRQRELIMEKLELSCNPVNIHPRNSNKDGDWVIRKEELSGLIGSVDYPHDFNILKRYVK